MLGKFIQIKLSCPHNTKREVWIHRRKTPQEQEKAKNIQNTQKKEKEGEEKKKSCQTFLINPQLDNLLKKLRDAGHSSVVAAPPIIKKSNSNSVNIYFNNLDKTSVF